MMVVALFTRVTRRISWHATIWVGVAIALSHHGLMVPTDRQTNRSLTMTLVVACYLYSCSLIGG